MSQKMFRQIATSLTVLAFLSATGCAHKKAEETPTEIGAATGTDENTLGDSDSGKAMGLQTVHFPYDSFTLDSAAKSALKANADLMKTKSTLKIQIEGHCDQSGGIQYNIALGEKRASATKKYLQDMGVSGDRLSTISYGKERPIDSSGTDAGNAKNRRANFVVTSK